MKLKVNGEEYESGSATLAALLEELRIESGRVAVEVNLVIVKRAEYEGVFLRDGDEIEIVNYVGGGSPVKE